MYKSLMNDELEQLWDNAQWVSSGFAFSPNNDAAILLVFRNKTPALQIFRQWQSNFGKTTNEEPLRLAIIEGEIPGQASGYTIHVTVGMDSSFKNIDISKITPNERLEISFMSRYVRSASQPGGLDNFKRVFASNRECLILPAFHMGTNIEIEYNLPIVKKNIIFRRVEDISEADIDFSVLNQY